MVYVLLRETSDLATVKLARQSKQATVREKAPGTHRVESLSCPSHPRCVVWSVILINVSSQMAEHCMNFNPTAKLSAKEAHRVVSQIRITVVAIVSWHTRPANSTRSWSPTAQLSCLAEDFGCICMFSLQCKNLQVSRFRQPVPPIKSEALRWGASISSSCHI